MPAVGTIKEINKLILSVRILSMYGVEKPLCNTLIAAVLWSGMTCCSYGKTPAEEPVTDCAMGTTALGDVMHYALPTVTDPTRTRQGYEQAISRIESQGGAYAYDLVPELIGLGMLEKQAGEFSESEKTFIRALYIIRMHKGLYSPDQIPLVEMLIENNSATGKWRTVADEFDLLYWLTRRGYGEDDPRQLPVLKRLRQWHINAYNKDTGRSLSQHFKAARELYNKALEILTACGEDKRIALCFWDESCCSGAGQGEDACPADNS